MMIYRNDDPPDEPEIPECCGEEMEDNGDCCVCSRCGAQLPYNADEGEFDLDGCEYPEPPEPPSHCPHDNDWGDCSDCDYAGDLAYAEVLKMSAYDRKKTTVARQRKVLSEIYDLTQEAPPIVIPPTMDKNLDASAQQLEELLVELATTLEQAMHLWDDNHDR